MKLIARCTSLKCQGLTSKALGVIKENVKYRQAECPDCKSILVWMLPNRINRTGQTSYIKGKK